MPAGPISLAMIGGVCLSRYAPVYPLVWVGLSLGLLLLRWPVTRFRWFDSLVLVMCVACSSLAMAQVRGLFYARDHIVHYTSDEPRLCQVRLYLPNEPRLRTMTFGDRFPTPPRQVTLARVTQVLTTQGWADTQGDVLVQIREPHPLLAAGQTVQAVGMLERPGEAMNPGQFDWQRYYRDMDVLCSLHIQHAQGITILDESPAPWITRLRESARRALADGFENESSLDAALLGALVLGDYDPELRDIKDQFRRTGTSHHLAISGMHIGVIGGIVFLGLRLMRFGPRACLLATMATVVFYGIIATPSPPVARSVILFIVAGVALLSGRFTRILQLLALTVAVMLLIHPLDLFNAGFQLSFVTVLGMVLLGVPMSVRFVNELDVLRSSELALRPRSERIKRWIDHRCVLTLSIGFVCWLVSMPLVARHFSQLNPWAVPASIVLAPFVVMSLCAGVLKIVLTWILPSSAPALASLAGGASAAMRWCVGLLAKAPAADVPLVSPPFWLVLLCWLSVALFVVRWRMNILRFVSIVLLAGTFGYMIIGPYVWGGPYALSTGQVRVTLLAVGAGQCAIVEPADGRVALIDCGSNSLNDLNANVVVPALRELGHTSIDRIFITHANTDHYSGVAEIADAYGVREIIVGETFEDSAHETGTGNALLRQLEALSLPPRVAHPGDRIPLSNACRLEVLWPTANSGFDANDNSLVVKLNVGERSMLFTGDIQSEGMRALVDGGNDLKSDVLVAMHHGSSEDNTADFVERVSPAWIVSSNDRTLSGKQARFDELMREKRLLRTNEHGAITILFDADGAVRVEGFLDQR